MTDKDIPDLSEIQKIRIKEFWGNTPEYCSYVESQTSIKITPIDLILALVEAKGKELHELVIEDWNIEKILSVIRHTERFEKLPIIQEEVVVDESIIPDHVIRGINEEQVKFKGEKWIVHKNDADPFPSHPHAHNYESGLKLHLGNGGLYSGTTCVGSIPCKKLKELRNLFVRTTMPALEC